MLDSINDFINWAINYLGLFGPVLGCVLIVIESILPILPLCVFITLNCMTFGYVLGFIISWVFTCIGCSLSYLLCDKFLKNKFDKKLRTKAGVDKVMKAIDKASVSDLAVIVAVPFTPAFAVNIAAGLSKMEYKKFITGILIGKLFMVYFWAFIGTSFIQSLQNPVIIIRVVACLFVAWLLSKTVAKKFHI